MSHSYISKSAWGMSSLELSSFVFMQWGTIYTVDWEIFTREKLNLPTSLLYVL